MQQMMQIAQFKPEILDNINADETARFIQEVNMVPISLQASEEEVAQRREAQAMQAQQMAQMKEAQTLGDLYSKTTKSPEGGSGAAQLMEQLGVGQE